MCNRPLKPKCPVPITSMIRPEDQASNKRCLRKFGWSKLGAIIDNGMMRMRIRFRAGDVDSKVGSSSIPSPADSLTGYRSSSSETLDAVFSSKSPERAHSLPRQKFPPRMSSTGLDPWITHQVRCHKRNDQRNMTMIQCQATCIWPVPCQSSCRNCLSFWWIPFSWPTWTTPSTTETLQGGRHRLIKKLLVGRCSSFLRRSKLPFQRKLWRWPYLDPLGRSSPFVVLVVHSTGIRFFVAFWWVPNGRKRMASL